MAEEPEFGYEPIAFCDYIPDCYFEPEINYWEDNSPDLQSAGNSTESNNSDDSALKYGFRLLCTTALHPIDYAKTLIQLGYEPIAPRPGRTLFGVRRLMLPNILQYTWHIGTVDGFAGCFRGLSAKLVGNILSSYYSEKVADMMGFHPPKSRGKKGTQSDELCDELIAPMRRVAVVHIAGVVISHPFHVISVRMMAQFIGREQLYCGLWQSVKEIWTNEGLVGFFSGIIPRLVVDVGCMAISSALTYLVSKYIVENRSIRSNVSAIAQFTVSSYLYPYHVVSTCMIVNGSRLIAGNPPLMPHFFGWRDCYMRLRMANEHKRGASYFFRAVAKLPDKLKNHHIIALYPELK